MDDPFWILVSFIACFLIIGTFVIFIFHAIGSGGIGTLIGLAALVGFVLGILGIKK